MELQISSTHNSQIFHATRYLANDRFFKKLELIWLVRMHISETTYIRVSENKFDLFGLSRVIKYPVALGLFGPHIVG